MLPVLIAFSHVRWGPSGSRPQHLLSRLAGRWRVLVVEEPVHCEGEARLQQHPVTDQLSVLVPHTPLRAAGFHDDQLGVLMPLLNRHLAAEGLRADLVWLSTPMALPLAHALHAPCIVYDCMEELGGHDNAPRQLAQRESALLKRAGLVFTAGPSLYESRRERHPRVHCLPNAVDAAHFAPARLDAGPATGPPARKLPGDLPRPRLGFHGPIDQRVDLALIAALADARPAWSLVMAGAVSAGVAASLPRRPNIHWIGAQRYEKLPALLAGWDLGLLPLAVSGCTRWASPLQTLEYLAAELPVVSTALRDVAWLYGEAVSMAGPGAEAFVQACEEALTEGAAARYRRAAAATSIVSMHSWDRCADTVHALLSQAIDQAHPADPPPLRVVAGGRRA